jgi:dipeptidase D
MIFKHQKTNDILNWFEQINQIPRESRHEEAICQWMINWAKQNHFAVKTDKVQNVLIKVPASVGYENATIVIIQGHLDMVCEKKPDSSHDFRKDPIKNIVDGEWLRADKTTLGADNGIAIAMAMVIALDKDIPHPPLELLFTIDEETGLNGASAIESGFLEGRILINIDSEQEGYLTIGCAGGFNTNIALPIEWAKITSNYQLMAIKAGGMTGGHSGIEIHAERASAIKVLAQTLHLIKQESEIQLVNFTGGTAHNAIPRDAEALVFIPENDLDKIKTILKQAENTFKAEYQQTDPNLFIKIENNETSSAAAIINTEKVINLILALPHGVATLSNQNIASLVETSNNIASISIQGNNLKILTSQRSAVESKLEALTQRIEAIARLSGSSVYSDNRYAAWQPKLDSPLLAKSCQIYERMFAKKPIIDVIHAGLECGIIAEKSSENMDMISIGPTIKYAHSPDETMNIETVGKVWDFLLELLKELK